MESQESTVLAVRRIAADTVCVRLSSHQQFTPGQFVTVTAYVPAAGKSILRSYSVCSAHNGEWIEVTIKAQEPGLLSQAAQHWQPGDRVGLQGPYGHFILNYAEHTEPVVFIAGGSGIAPFRCMLQTARKTLHCPITVLYSVKTSEDILYHDELQSLCAEVGAALVVTLTRPTAADLAHWTGAFGRVTGKLLRDTLGDVHTRRYYICGPTPMVKDVETLLASLGVEKKAIQSEKYGQIDG